jgi:hypothetical protein
MAIVAGPAIYSTTAQEGIDINAVFFLDTSTLEYPAPPFQPGELAWGTDGSEWIYCTASVSIDAGSAVILNPFAGSWSVQALGGGTGGATVVFIPQGTANAANGMTVTNPYGALCGVVGGSLGTMTVNAPSGTQTQSFFWVQRAGNVPNLKMSGTGTVFTQLHTTTTAGALSAAGGGTNTILCIQGIQFTQTTASSTGPNPAVSNYPYVGASVALTG